MADAVYYLAQQGGGHETVEASGAGPAHVQAEVGAHEAAPDGERGGGGPMKQEPNLSVYTAIAFLIVVAGLYRLVPHLLKALDERAAKISGDLDAAESARTDAEKLQAQYEQQLADAREEARRIIDDARQQADAQGREIVAKAQEEAAGLKQKAQEEIEGEKARAVKDLRGQIGDLSCAVASRLIQETVSPEAHRSLIDRFIEELSAGDGSRN